MAFKDFLFKKEEKKESPHVGTPPINLSTTFMANPVVNTSTGGEYEKHLDSVMRKNNQPGLDYLEFADALNSLATQPLSEQQKYILTFPTYSSMGLSGQKLEESANFYIGVLQKEGEDFKREMGASRDAGITQKNAQIVKLKNDIDELTRQIQQKTEQMGKLNQEVNENTNKLSLADNNFNVALNNRIAIIKDHISKIQNYLNNGAVTK